MPYAHNNQISQDPIEGGIEITAAQYQEALVGMCQGKVVSIDGGFSVAAPVVPEPEVPPPLTLSEIKAAKWGEIKTERDRRKNGGVLIDGKWFHSDDASRIQQIALVMFGVSVPPVEWKTMDGTFVTMSQSLASDIFQGMAAADQVNFANAETHRIAMEASADPAGYDFSSGWMPIYEEQ